MAKHRAWVFTLNNYSDEEENKLFDTPDGVRYICCGREIGESGTPHLQGYMVFDNQVRISTCKKLLPRAHWEVRRGTDKQAREYCMKEGSFWEVGTPLMTQEDKGEAGKAAIQERWALAKLGKFEELPPEMIKTYEYIHRKYVIKQDLPILENYWICGPSGCGKSRYVRDNYPGFFSKRMNKWWDGYNHEEVVLLDDIDDTHSFVGHDLKIWADRYAFPAEVKGGNYNSIRPKHVIVTSQYSIGEVFKDQKTCEAIRRRFIEVEWCRLNECFVLNNKPFHACFNPERHATIDELIDY